MNYDAIIVGAGPAGLTAGKVLAQEKYGVLLLEKESFGGQPMSVEWIEDYPRAGERIPGPMLASRLVEEAQAAGVHLEQGAVIEIESYSGFRSVRCEDGKAYTASVVILAGGLHPRKLGLPVEQSYQGKGLIHCAMCDAGLYKGRTVAICGGGNAALTEALYLAHHASKVIVAEARERLTATSALEARARANPKIEIRCGETVVGIAGGEYVSGIEVRNAASGRQEILDAYGVLVRVGFEPATDYLEGAVALDDGGYIEVNERCATEESGILAAGDIRRGSARRVASAVDDGTMAAATARRMLMELKQEA